MKQKVTYIGIYQLTLLTITVIISTADIMLPSIIARISGRNSWISVIIAGLASMAIMLLILKLMQRFPQKGILEITQYAFGPWIGSLFCLIFGFLFIFYNSLVVRQIADVMFAVFIPSQSITLFVILTMIIVAVSVYYGLECISRVNEIFIPLGITALVSVIGFSIKRMDFNNFLPLLDYGIKPVLRGSMTLVFWFMETVTIAFLIPNINKYKFAALSSAITIVVITSALLMGVLIIAVFGTEYTSKMLYSPVNLLSYVRIGKYYDTLDIFIMFIWAGGVLIKSSVLIYLAVQSFSAVAAGVQKSDYLIIPVSILSSVFALTEFNNPVELSSFLSFYAPVTGILTIILPFIIILSAIAKKRLAN